MHHYNFPPFSTGETGRVGSPKRREIGHGALAERALVPVVPSQGGVALHAARRLRRARVERLHVDGVGLRLDALADGRGVPIKAPVAGIAMGLVYAEGKYTTLTDILGAEDAFGDMDFKVAGTRDFVTALQLDTKIDGLPADVLAQGAAPGQGRPAQDPRRDGRRDRRHRATTCAPTAPKIISFEIPIDKIGEVIGPKGKVINTITAGDRRRRVGERRRRRRHGEHRLEGRRRRSKRRGAGSSSSSTRRPPSSAPSTPGKVVNITKFGAFVNILPGRDGLLHISKLGRGKRIDRVEDVLNLGDEVHGPRRRHRQLRQALALARRATSGRRRRWRDAAGDGRERERRGDRERRRDREPRRPR